MECQCLRAAELPHATRLFATFLDDFSRVSKFYSHPPTEEGVLRSAKELLEGRTTGSIPGLDAERRSRVVEILREQNDRFGSDAATRQSLNRLASGAVAVVTGQQVGLFSGPAYSFYKGLTGVAVARALTAGGTEAVPVFWLATEDHDLAEVKHSDWLDRQGHLQRIEVEPEEDASGRRVGEVRLGNAVIGAVQAACDLLEGPGAASLSAALGESYRPAETFGSAFGKLMARVLAGRGIILLDPLDARLHRLAAAVYRRGLQESAALTGELLARGKALERAGFHAQVKVTDRSTLLFLNVEGQRLPLRRRQQEFVAGRSVFSRDELLEAIERTPEALSPNVLLRPVVQDALLPTAAYVAGPAEVAYFAQAEVIYRRLLGRMPAVLARAGFTVVEPRAARLLKKYRLELRDILRGRQHMTAAIERQALPKSLGRQFSSGEKTLRRMLGALRRPLGRLDQTLVGALDSVERKMFFQFLKLRAKAGRAENFRSGVLDEHERILLHALYPHRGLQERTLCFLPFLAAHGPALLDEVERRAGFSNTQHQVLFL